MKADWRSVYSPCPCAWSWQVCRHKPHTRGAWQNIRAVSLSLPPSFFFSLTCVFPTDTPLSSPPSHLHAYSPSFYPSKTKESKKQRRRCAYEYVVGLGLVVRNGKRTFEFWMDGWKDCMKLTSGVCFWQGKDGWYFKTFMAYKYQFDNITASSL